MKTLSTKEKVVTILISLVLVLSNCSRADPPTAPDPEPDPTPCEPVECKPFRVTGVWDIVYWQDPSVNNYAILQNDSLIFSRITASGIFTDVHSRVQGTYKQGDIIELVAKGSRASIRVKFIGEEKR